jgi:hypothetical protein
MHALRTRTAGAALAVAIAGCSIVRPYTARPEVCDDGVDQDVDGALDCADPDCAAACDEHAQCANDRDDDLDGRVDCTDPDCDGAAECAEEAALCGDGRDNDLDGRTDARDAGCWPVSRITTERCASNLASSLELGPRDFVGGALAVDPLGIGEGEWMSVPSTPGVTTPTPSIVSRTLATGALDGTRATAVFWLDGDAAPTSVLDPAVVLSLAGGASARSSSRTIDLAVGGAGTILTGALVREPPLGRALSVGPGQRARVTLTVEIEGRTVRAAFQRDGEPEPTRFEAELGEAWVDGPGIEIGASAARGGGVWLERASIERPRHVRCGTSNPPIGIALRDGLERTDTAIQAVARGEGATLCGIAGMRVSTWHEIVAIRSEDDGATWARGDTLALGTGFSSSDGRWHSLAWDPVTARFFAASTDDTRLVVQSSADCLTWEEESTAAADVALDTFLVFGRSAPSYRIDSTGHEARLFVGLTGGDVAFVPWRSPWGDPGTWSAGDAEDDEGTWDTMRLPIELRYATRVEHLGAPVRVGDGGTSIRVRTSAGWTDLASLAARPSDEPGAYDAVLLLGPASFVEDAEPPAPGVWSGRLFHTGTSDAADVGWGWTRVRIDPPGAP